MLMQPRLKDTFTCLMIRCERRPNRPAPSSPARHRPRSCRLTDGGGCDLGLDRLRQQRSRAVAVCGSGKVPGCESWKSLVSVTAYHSFGGEVGLEHPDTPPYPPTPSPTGVAARECLPRRTATISARIEIAISSGVIAPRSSPAGALSLARRSAETPRSASFAFSASAFLWLPTNARYSA